MSAVTDLKSGADTSKVRDACLRARHAARAIAVLSGEQRNAALERMAVALERAQQDLLAANAQDMARAQSLRGEEALAPATLARLQLTVDKLREMADQVRSVAALPDPLGRTLSATELDDRDPAENVAGGAEHGLYLRKVSVPLGVLAVIFEARPDAVTQIAALALKSGNAALLKPGREVEHTATALLRVLRAALEDAALPADALSLVLGRDDVVELLGAHDLVDMVIPRGSKQLVDFVQANTRIPVLGHSEGVCHIYVDLAADQAMALRLIADAKLDYPAACNAVETVLVHEGIAKEFVPQLSGVLTRRGVRVHGDAAVREMTGADPVQDWHREYGAPELAVGVVASLEDAIDHIHHYGSAHTESIVTDDAAAAERFLREVDAAGVFHNASTRFADGYRYGFGAEVGISTSKLHARGPVGLEGLTTYKYVLRGSGHLAGDYRGEQARSFTHRQEPAAESASLRDRS